MPPTTQHDILEILQHEQDHAVSLLSLSPLLSSLFVSYANRASTLGSAPSAPLSENEEWKALQDTIAALREENGKLKSETSEMAGKLEAAETSQEVFRSEVSSLKEASTTQQEEIKALRAELSEAKDKYDRVVVDSNLEAALKAQISDLEVGLEFTPDRGLDAVIDIRRMVRRNGDI